MYNLIVPSALLRTTTQTRNGRVLYEVAEDFKVRYHSEALNLTIIVPKGFITDLASVPRFFWRLFPPGGVYNEAAIIHDYLYDTNCDRRFADTMFRLIMN